MTIQHRTNVFWLRIALTLVAITVTTSIAHADTTSVSGPNGTAGVAGTQVAVRMVSLHPTQRRQQLLRILVIARLHLVALAVVVVQASALHRQTVATAVWEEKHSSSATTTGDGSATILRAMECNGEARVAAGIRPGAGQSFGTVRLERVAKEALQLPRHRQAAHTHPIRSWSLLLPSVEQAAVAPAAFRTRVWGAMVE